MNVVVVPSTFHPRGAELPLDYVFNSWSDRAKYYKSVEALPRWIQERIAVLRLLEEDEPNPLGKWSIGSGGFQDETLYLFIVRQPDDPEWEE